MVCFLSYNQLGEKLLQQIIENLLTDYNLKELMDTDPKLIILTC